MEAATESNSWVDQIRRSAPQPACRHTLRKVGIVLDVVLTAALLVDIYATWTRRPAPASQPSAPCACGPVAVVAPVAR